MPREALDAPEDLPKQAQHASFRTITATLHVHLDAHACLEVIAMRGTPRRIRRLANELIAVKGVRYGQLVPATTGRRLA